MADFRKALANLAEEENPHPALRATLSRRERDPLLPSIADQLSFLKTRMDRPVHLAATLPDPLPPGAAEATPYGSHYVAHTVYPHDHFHGKVRLNRFSCESLERLMFLMRATACGVSQGEVGEVAFLDTETTGIQGGAGVCPFLVGVGYFEADEFHMVQYFIRDFDEEPAMLHSLGELLRRFRLVITYNGAAFDIPLLETRFTLARQNNAFSGKAHFDLLFTARRLWRNGHGSCRLAALEGELLSFFRGHDIPGAMIPRVYFDYLHYRQSAVLGGVFTHNLHDVVSLLALTIHACDRVTLEAAPLDEPLDLYSLAHVLETSDEWQRSIGLYEMALAGDLPEPVRRKALESLSVLYRRFGDPDRSYRICCDLMAADDFSMTAYEGAAIYFERAKSDLDSSLRVVEEGMRKLEQTTDRKRPRILLYARWQRLQQRVIKGIL